jgi:heptosyltransferase-2/heptosyltransferase-3
MSAPAVQPIVIWLGRVGDMILLSALLGILHRRYGAPCHLIGAGSWPAELYATHRDVAQVTCLHRYTAFLFDRAWWRARRALRRSRGAPVYVCEYDPRKLVRIRRLLRAGGIDSGRCLFITNEMSIAPPRRAEATPYPTLRLAPAHRVDAPANPAEASPQGLRSAPAHWVDRLTDFAQLTPPAFNVADYPLAVDVPRAVSAPHLEVTAAALADCDAWIASQGWTGRPLVLVQPGNRRTMRGRKLRISAQDDKAWPIERWAALLRQINARMPQSVIVLCGAPRETLLLGWIADAVRLPAVVPAELPLTRLLALCTRAHSMVSVDTGPAHAAAALSLPLVVLFGAHAQQEWLPRSPSGSAVVGIGGPPVSDRLDQIQVETVLAAWCALPGRDTPGREQTQLSTTAAHATGR